MSLMKLPYLKDITSEVKTPTGFTEIIGVDSYNGAYIRNNYVFKVDIITYLSSIFSESTTNTDRNAIYLILSGKAFQSGLYQEIVDVFKSWCESDVQFRLFLSKCMSYHENDEMFSNNSLFNVFLNFVYKDIDNIRKIILNNVPHRKYLFESHLYMYFSINNDIDMSVLTTIKGLEVLTR